MKLQGGHECPFTVFTLRRRCHLPFLLGPQPFHSGRIAALALPKAGIVQVAWQTDGISSQRPAALDEVSEEHMVAQRYILVTESSAVTSNFFSPNVKSKKQKAMPKSRRN